VHYKKCLFSAGFTYWIVLLPRHLHVGTSYLWVLLADNCKQISKK